MKSNKLQGRVFTTRGSGYYETSIGGQVRHCWDIDEQIVEAINELDKGFIRYKNKILRVDPKRMRNGDKMLLNLDGIQVGVVRPDQSFELWEE